ncbi:MAG TPA: class I SAM-dependent methyltransferase [Acidimicrobiales bacterium]|nr:class I SAM-dependent methyltransferase [Acidimicrobiales bacterium]
MTTTSVPDSEAIMAEAMAFAGVVAADLGAAAIGAMAVIGDRLGLYRALAAAGPVTSTELAARTGCAERYVREWLCSQAAAGWVAFDEESERFELPQPQAIVLAQDDSPLSLAASIQLLNALYASVDRLSETFLTGDGIGWGEHHADLHDGVARFSRSSLSVALPGWVTAAGVAGRLDEGGKALDVGCGQGSALVALAKAFPRAHVEGVDSHAPSVEAARRAAADAGVTGRVTVRVAEGADLSGSDEGTYDLVMLVDCLHDMGDPVAAARAARSAVAPGGAVLIVEPASSDSLVANFNPVGRYYYAISTAFCMPSALSQTGGWALGNQAGPARVLDICDQAGFRDVSRLDATPFNMVFCARP